MTHLLGTVPLSCDPQPGSRCPPRPIVLCFNVHVSVTILQEATPQETGVQGAPSNLSAASPTSPTQGLVMSGSAPVLSMGASSSRAASSGRQAGAQPAVEAAPGRPTPDIAQPSSARDQVRPSCDHMAPVQQCCRASIAKSSHRVVLDGCRCNHTTHAH